MVWRMIIPTIASTIDKSSLVVCELNILWNVWKGFMLPNTAKKSRSAVFTSFTPTEFATLSGRELTGRGGLILRQGRFTRSRLGALQSEKLRDCIPILTGLDFTLQNGTVFAKSEILYRRYWLKLLQRRLLALWA